MRRWFTHDITVEQAIGQLLQIVQEIERRLKELENKDKPGGVPVRAPRR
ncbi:MAG TPA: hypothetical protein VJG32_17090 [Anaerolineae bacterium]|nr:hypothetical protein [Anaerolineae bacterium]